MHTPMAQIATSLAILITGLISLGASAAEIDVPPGHVLALSLDASGVQIYDCKTDATAGYVWVFRAPEASLTNKEGQLVARHYAGPTWESKEDGSKIQGTRLASTASLSPGAIAQLLLSATVLKTGKTFGDVSFIQRVRTVGGSAPATGCDTNTLGAELKVPYTASYLFFRKS